MSTNAKLCNKNSFNKNSIQLMNKKENLFPPLKCQNTKPQTLTTNKPIKTTSNENSQDNKENNTLITSHNLENYILNISLTKAKITNNEYIQLITKIYCDNYSKSLLSYMFIDEESNENFLDSHNINQKMRTRMVDWMIEVLTNYHCQHSTFFESVRIMDKYFKICIDKNKIIEPEEIHLIGLTSMFIASKYFDVYPLRVRWVRDKIAHNKVKRKEIKSKEEEIEEYLNFIIGKPNIWDFMNVFIEEIFPVSANKHQISNKRLLQYIDIGKNEEDKNTSHIIKKLYTENMIILLRHVCIYLAKMNYHDYGLSQLKPSLLSASTLYVALKICEEINKEEYINEYFKEKLYFVSKRNEDEVVKIGKKILFNAQNFDKVFPCIENLKKIHFNKILDLKVTK